MSIEVMKQALEALERSVSTCFDRRAHEDVMSRPEHFINQTITALRTAIAEAEKSNIKQVIHLYDEPPAAQRQWVGFTDEEINEYDYEHRDFIYDIEALLKHKNTRLG